MAIPSSAATTATRREAADTRAGSGNAAALAAVDWLCLAAAPTFAIMALLTGVLGPSDKLCSAAQDASPLSGMIPMYLLMSAFHSAPWLKLISSWRSGARHDRAGVSRGGRSNCNDVGRGERSVALLLGERDHVLTRRELISSGSQRGNVHVGRHDDRLHPTCVLNGERRALG